MTRRSCCFSSVTTETWPDFSSEFFHCTPEFLPGVPLSRFLSSRDKFPIKYLSPRLVYAKSRFRRAVPPRMLALPAECLNYFSRDVTLLDSRKLSSVCTLNQPRAGWRDSVSSRSLSDLEAPIFAPRSTARFSRDDLRGNISRDADVSVASQSPDCLNG
jgi:hypothetical protein